MNFPNGKNGQNTEDSKNYCESHYQYIYIKVSYNMREEMTKYTKRIPRELVRLV